MKFTAIFAAFFFAAFCFFSCGKTTPGKIAEPRITRAEEKTEEEPAPATAEPETLPETLPETQPEPTETKETEEKNPEIIPQPTHAHQFVFTYRLDPTCTREGQEVFTCACGETTTKPIAKLAHQYTQATCTKIGKCTVCGATTPALGHHIVGENCTRCGEAFPEQLYVLGEGLEFNDAKTRVREKLGIPTEVLTEGEMITFVYAADYRKFTLVQIDDVGVWGVFTLDPNAFCRVDGVNIGIASFSEPIRSGDYRQAIFGDLCLTSFCDSTAGGANWSVWFRLREVGYHYAADSEINRNFYAQEKICFYLTNALRVKNGVPVLHYSPQAAAVARDFAAVLTESEVFDHDDSYKTRLTAQGVNWFWIGENISQGYDNVFEVVNAYYNSGPHRANMLNSHYTHLGTGFALAGENSFVVYGAQEFYSLS